MAVIIAMPVLFDAFMQSCPCHFDSPPCDGSNNTHKEMVMSLEKQSEFYPIISLLCRWIDVKWQYIFKSSSYNLLSKKKKSKVIIYF